MKKERWSNEEFYNPFGPNILQLKLDEDLRLDLLNLVKNHSKTELKESNIIRIGVHDKSKKIDEDILNVQNNTVTKGIWGSMDDSWLQTKGTLIQATIENLLCRYTTRFYKRSLNVRSHIHDIWYVIMKAGDFHVLHSHRALLSGAIYLEVPDSLPYPQGAIVWNLGGGEKALYNNTLMHSPLSGDVFLWPGWLQHMVYPFKQENANRTMISFNGKTDIEVT